MPLHQFYNLYKTSQPTFHNLCTFKTPPAGIDQLLWNGLKFCIEKPLPKPRLQDTFDRLTADIRLKYFWLKQATTPDLGDYNKKLYIKSTFKAKAACPAIESALSQFKSKITSTVKTNLSGQKRKHNLPTCQRKLLKYLADNKEFITLNTDKNLGFAFIERCRYKQRCLKDHLSDNKTYKQITQQDAQNKLKGAVFQFKLLIDQNRKTLPESEKTFFTRSFEQPRRIPQFYCTPKVHKKPVWKTRPIVSCINSRLGDLSKWVDVQLQRVKHLCPCYLKDSRSLLRKLKRLGKLPPTAFIVTADATSMYTNIDTDHGLQTLKLWFELHAHELPHKFPVNMVLKAVELVMRNNIFQFDNTYWLQLTGTAMGTSLACMYATIYYSYHEETRLLPVYAHQFVVPPHRMPQLPDELVSFYEDPPLLLHARLIDDAIQIWDTAKMPAVMQTHFKSIMEDKMKFGVLEWEAEHLSKSVDFLDLTISIQKDGSIATKTFVKPMNLHLYLPPNSAHPKGVPKSLVFGTLQRYWIQNSSKDDFISAASDFYGYLLNRGHTHESLNLLFLDAAAALDRKYQADQHAPEEELWDTPEPSFEGRYFIHWEYHPRDISREAIRQIFNETLAPALQESGLPVNQLTIAYSRAKNLGECLTKTQLEEPEGIRVSSYIEPTDPLPANL